MMVHLCNEKLNYHFEGGDPSVVSEPRQDNMERQDVEEKARGWASGQQETDRWRQSCQDLGRARRRCESRSFHRWGQGLPVSPSVTP